MEEWQERTTYRGITASGVGSVQRARERAERGMLMRNQIQITAQQLPSASQQPGALQNFSRTRPGNHPFRTPPRAIPARPGVGLAVKQPITSGQWPLSEPRVRSRTREYSKSQIRPPADLERPAQRSSQTLQTAVMGNSSQQTSLPARNFHLGSGQGLPKDPSAAQQAMGPQQLMALSDQVSPILTPQTLGSRTSTTSTTGSIPDFPAPTLISITTNTAKRPGYHGPPPTTRRGGSSYYSNASFVSPIPEESPRSYSHGTYASSSVMPKSWSECTPSEEVQRGVEHSMHTTPTADHTTFTIKNNNTSISSAIVESANTNERHEPRSPTKEGANELTLHGAKSQSTADGNLVDAEEAYHSDDDTRTTSNSWQGATEATSPLASGTGLIDSSTSSEEGSLASLSSAKPLQQISDRRVAGVLDAYAAASKPGRDWTDSPAPERKTPAPVSRQHPDLSTRAGRDLEARGSLTSLPDLIRRATRLAALMDSGKRPASRLKNLNDPGDPDDDERDLEKRFSGESKRPYSGLSGMLAAFPPPGLSAPVTRDGLPQSRGRGPVVTPRTRMVVPSRSGQPLNRRCCCGISLAWLVILAFLLFIVGTIAIIVPLEILVLHKPNPTVSSLSSCQASMKCQNGGTNIVSDGMCACICENGFTGSTCVVPGLTGCTTTTFTGSSAVVYTNSTIGNAIPRLLTLAQSFAVPLVAETVLARFNAAGLACGSENALVTFDGLNGLLTSNTTSHSPSSAIPAAMTAAVTQRRRDKGLTTISAITTQTLTSVNPTITFDALSSHSTTVTSFATLTTPTLPPTPTTRPTSPFAITQTTIDFARVAVLFVLQQVELTSAIAAQNAMQVFIDKPGAFAAAKNVSLFGVDGAASASVDFVALNVFVTGMLVGGTGAGSDNV